MKPSRKPRRQAAKGWDVIFPSITNRGNYEDPNAPGGIWLTPIDETRANLKAIIPSFLRDSIQLGAVYRGNRYLIPYDWGTEGITFNSTGVDLKDTEVSFGDLWRPEVKGKVAFRQKSVIMGTGLYLDSIGLLQSNRHARRLQVRTGCTSGVVRSHGLDHRAQGIGSAPSGTMPLRLRRRSRMPES